MFLLHSLWRTLQLGMEGPATQKTWLALIFTCLLVAGCCCKNVGTQRICCKSRYGNTPGNMECLKTHCFSTCDPGAIKISILASKGDYFRWNLFKSRATWRHSPYKTWNEYYNQGLGLTNIEMSSLLDCHWIAYWIAYWIGIDIGFLNINDSFSPSPLQLQICTSHIQVSDIPE